MTDIILAGSYRAGHSTATNDWGWRRIAEDTYETPDGRRARIAVDGKQLRGLTGVRVFLAWQHWLVRDRHILDWRVAGGDLTITDPAGCLISGCPSLPRATPL